MNPPRGKVEKYVDSNKSYFHVSFSGLSNILFSLFPKLGTGAHNMPSGLISTYIYIREPKFLPCVLLFLPCPAAAVL